MISLDRVLRKHYIPIGHMGELPPSAGLVDDLQAHYRLNVKLYVSALVLMAIAYCGLVGLLVMRPSLTSAEFVGALAALGGVTAALFEMARRTVRGWSQSKLLLIAAKTLSLEQTMQLITKVLEDGKG